LDFIRRTEPDAVFMSLATPYPGIELYDVMKEQGWKVFEDWSHCDMQTSVFENPSLPVDLMETRRRFYNQFYSVSYILRQWFKGTFYSQNMAQAGLNQLLWRTKLPRLVSANFKKLTLQKSQGEQNASSRSRHN
jgi:hypothetical protein